LLHIVIDGQALAACILTKIHGQLSVSMIKSPSFGYNHTSILGDLGLLTGVTEFSDDLEIKLGKATHDLLGSTDSIPKEDSIFLNGDGGNTAWTEHCSVIPQLVNLTGRSSRSIWSS
jgi:chaperonin GroEL